MKIAIQAPPKESEIIHELLSPWEISFTNSEEAEVVISCREKSAEAFKTVVVPSMTPDFLDFSQAVRCRPTVHSGTLLSVQLDPQTKLSITPSKIYQYELKAKSSPDYAYLFKPNENAVFLTVDLVHEFIDVMNRTLNARTSTTYRLLTGSPIPYTIAPSRLRNFLTNSRQKKPQHQNQEGKLPIDTLRLMIAKALEELIGKKLSKRAWKKKKYVCTITHDVETKNGLQNAKNLKKLEERYGVPSAWYIPSKHFALDTDTVRELANHGEIGAHDTKHDGKLVYLQRDRLVERLVEARKTLTRIAEQKVNGFRAPLLQHNPKIIQALADAGYVYDTSIPTWEPNHPCTMKPHGIGTVFPFRLGSLVELPVTQTQDHQLLTVFGMSPREVVTEWSEMTNLIRSLGGICMFLVHPDYELGDLKSGVYEEILQNISTDNEAWIALPSEVAAATSPDTTTI